MTARNRLSGSLWRPWRNSLLSILFTALVLPVTASALTLNIVQKDGTAIGSGFSWLVEEDNTNQSTPQTPSATSIGLDIHKSYAPVVASGESAGASTVIDLPADQPYIVSALPYAGYSMSGIMVAAGQTDATIVVQPYNPGIPTAQISVFVFDDKYSINNAPDLPDEQGLAGFTVVIDDTAGLMMQDTFGNMLGTTYLRNADGTFNLDVGGNPQVVDMGTGIIRTDAFGEVLIKNLAPGKYGVRVIPPTFDDAGNAVEWIQTATIEGTPTVDAWVKANEPELFIEGFGTGFYHAFFGFVNPASFPWAAGGGGTGSIDGTLRYNHFSRPPNLQSFSPGATVDSCWAGLNDPTTGEGLIIVPCDDNSVFTFSNVPAGTYQLVTWDTNLDALFGFNTVTIADGEVLNLGDVLSFRWFGTFQGTVFEDLNENGFMDAGENGLAEQNINIRFRDGTIYQAQPTDVFGGYELSEVFPFFKWLVIEVDFARFKATGMTAVIDQGGPVQADAGWSMPSFDKLNPQPQATTNPNTGNNLSRTETGEVLTQAMHLFLGQTNVVDFGKKAYAPGENGGISGVVLYAVTRAEDDPRFAAAEEWEPGIPRVQVALYRDRNQDGSIDDLNGDGLPTRADVDNYPFGWMDGGTPGTEDLDRNSNGSFDAGDALNISSTDSWDDSNPTGCIQTIPVIAGQPAKECFDNFGTWNQIRPGVFDGGYAFASYFPGGITSGSLETDGLPTDTYLVEAATPPEYILLKEEDKNVDFGDIWTPSTQLLPTYCVGDLHTVPALLSFQTDSNGLVLPGLAFEDLVPSPFGGEDRPLCDLKQVRLADGLNAATDFFFFTKVPKAARAVGFVNNDLAAEFDPTSPIFGEKSAPAWIPISFQDWEGNEVARVYADEYGAYNAMLPSTYTVNLPTAMGVSPNMLTLVLNDPGPIPNPDPTGPAMIVDPNYDPDFSVTPWTFNYYAGRTSYLDTPIVPVAAFAQTKTGGIDVEPPTLTPVIASATGPGGGALICDDDTAVLTITAVGDAYVDNPDYDETDPTSVARIIRDFGFGINQGAITLSGDPLTVTIWSNTEITATVPAGTITGSLIVTRLDSGLNSPFGVSVTVDCAAVVINVPADQPTIQAAIDAAAPGTLISVAPGTYPENIIFYKNVALMGAGAASTTISATPVPTERLTAWHQKIEDLGFGPFAANEAPGIIVVGDPAWADDAFAPKISGFTIQGSLAGGGIDVSNEAHNLEISHNLVTNNQGNFGGGIIVGTPQVDDSNNDGLNIHHNRINKNGGIQGAGGLAIYSDATGYMVTDNQIEGNFTRFSGGGIAHIGLSDGGLIARNEILFNEVFHGGLAIPGGHGGGIYLSSEIAGVGGDGAGSITIEENLIQGNLAGAGSGGGINAFSINGQDVAASPGDNTNWYQLTIRNNMIVNNVAALAAGGIVLQDVAKGVIEHNTIAYNDSTATAALAFPPGNLSISTPQGAGIVSNVHSAGLSGTGIGQTFSNPDLTNNIIWQNRSFYTDSTLNGGRGGLLFASTHPTAAGPDFWDLQVAGTGVPADQFNPMTSVLTDTAGYHVSNSSGDPAFVRSYTNQLETAAVLDEGGNFISLLYQPLYQSAGDYHLGSPYSAAVDTGQDLGVVRDIDGDLRDDGAPDIGADEFNPGAVVTYSNLILFAPNGGEMLPGGSSFIVRWGAPAAQTFDLSYNLGSGTPWQSVATGLTGNGYLWPVPSDIRNVTTARFAVSSSGGETVISAAPFSIDVLALQTPNGGELIVSGTTYSILWTERYAPTATQAAIWFQEAGGMPWQPLGTVPAGGRYDWDIPNRSTTLMTARIGLMLYDGTGALVLSDFSDAPFTLMASTIAAAPAQTAGVTPFATVASAQSTVTSTPVSSEATIVVLSPAGGEVYTSGEVIPVMWDATVADQTAEISLWFRTAPDSAWVNVAIDSTNSGFIDWTVPDIGVLSDSCQLEVRRLNATGQIIDRASSERFSVEPGQQAK
jgi:hypothetical protein